MRAAHTTGATYCAYASNGTLVTVGTSNTIRLYMSVSDVDGVTIEESQGQNFAVTSAVS